MKIGTDGDWEHIFIFPHLQQPHGTTLHNKEEESVCPGMTEAPGTEENQHSEKKDKQCIPGRTEKTHDFMYSVSVPGTWLQ